MYLVRYYDGIWHQRFYKSQKRAYAVFDAVKDRPVTNHAPVMRVEVYALDRLFDYWEDVAFDEGLKDLSSAYPADPIRRKEAKDALNRIYGEKCYEDCH